MKIFNKYFILIIAVGFVLEIFFLVLISKCYKSDIINMGLLVATVALAVIAQHQLSALREQANADFLLKFNREFFGSETNQKIVTAIEEKNNVLEENKGEFTDYQLDDYLGYYELMSWYEKKGLVDFELIDEMFGHYISLAWQNDEIKKYIDKLRDDTKNPRYYKPFEDLAMRVIAKEKEIRNQTT
jgi:hypothetical protein